MRDHRSRRLATVVLSACLFASCLNAQENEVPASPGNLLELRRENVVVLEKLVDVCRARYLGGTEGIESLLQAEVSLARARVASATTPAERIEKLKELVTSLRQHENHAAARHEMGAGREDALLRAKSGRISAEIMLLEERLRQRPPADAPAPLPRNNQ